MADSKKAETKPQKVKTPDVPAASPDSGLSRQSTFSTIEPNTEVEPGAGRHVLEILGPPSKKKVL